MSFGSIIKRAAKSSISIRLLSICFGFVSSVLINRALGIELRGVYTTVYTYATLLQAVLNLGLAFSYAPLAKEYGFERAKSALATVIWAQALLCALVAAAFCVFFGEGRAFEVAVLASALVVNGQMVFLALLGDIRSRNNILLGSSILYCIGNTAIMLFVPECFEAVFALLIARLLLEVVLCAKQQQLFMVDLRSVDCGILGKMLSYGIPTALLAALIQCNYNIDVVVMNALGASDVQLGIFGVAYTLSNMLWFIPDAFKELVYYDSARGVAARRTLALIGANVVVCLAVCIGFAFLGNDFLGIAYGDEYRIAFSTVMTVFIGIVPMVVFKLVHPIYVNEGKALKIVVPLVISIALNAAVAAALIPEYGAFGAALATVAAYAACGLMILAIFMRDYRLGPRDLPAGVRELFRGK